MAMLPNFTIQFFVPDMIIQSIHRLIVGMHIENNGVLQRTSKKINK